MRKLHLTDIKLLPEITEEDKELLIELSHKYRYLPFDELCWLIRDIRNELNDGLSEFREDSRLKATYEILSESEIKEIVIKTNKGAINVKISDPVFDQYFKSPIKRIKRDFRESLNSENEFLKSLIGRAAFAKILIYFKGISKNDNQMFISIGMFLVHFKLHVGEPYKTKDQFKDCPQTISYERHLREIARKRVEKYSKDLSI